jgi:hypothetical protein
MMHGADLDSALQDGCVHTNPVPGLHCAGREARADFGQGAYPRNGAWGSLVGWARLKENRTSLIRSRCTFSISGGKLFAY